MSRHTRDTDGARPGTSIDTEAVLTGGVYHGGQRGVIGFDRLYVEERVEALYVASEKEVCERKFVCHGVCLHAGREGFPSVAPARTADATGVVGPTQCARPDPLPPPRPSPQLAREMEPICAALLNEKADWEVQRESMRKLRQLMLGGAGEVPSFAPRVAAVAHRLAKLVRSGAGACAWCVWVKDGSAMRGMFLC